jgi:hypothetical protein
MQSHWFAYADRAVFNPWFLRGLALRGSGSPGEDQPVRHFPYIDDWGGSHRYSLPPWQARRRTGLTASPGTVEDLPQRIARIVALYTNGLGTIEALRRMTGPAAPGRHRHRPSSETGRSTSRAGAAPDRHRAGPFPASRPTTSRPLMRWPLSNDAVVPSPPTVFVRRRPRPSSRGTPTKSVFAAAVAPIDSTAAARSGSGSPTATRFRPARRCASGRRTRPGSG